jgi:hypothetical protein
MSSFGASAPAEVLYEKFGITAENVAQTAMGCSEPRGPGIFAKVLGQSGRSA